MIKPVCDIQSRVKTVIPAMTKWQYLTSDFMLELDNCAYWLQQKNTYLIALCLGLSGVSQYQKGKTNMDFAKARDSEWQWH